MITGWQLKTPCGKGKYLTERSPTLQAALERRAVIEAEQLRLNADRDLELQRVRDAEAAENVSVPAAAAAADDCWLQERFLATKLSRGSAVAATPVKRNLDGTFRSVAGNANPVLPKRKHNGWAKTKGCRQTEWNRCAAAAHSVTDTQCD